MKREIAMLSPLSRLLHSSSKDVFGEIIGLGGLCVTILAVLYLPALV